MSIKRFNEFIKVNEENNYNKVSDLTEEMQDKLDSMLGENGATDYELDVENQVVFFVDGVGHRIETLDVIPVKDLL